MHGYAFVSPQTLEEVCQQLAEAESKLIAGGTDVIPQMRDGRLKAERLVDLSRVEGLSNIERSDGTISIGALTTYTMIRHSTLLQSTAPLLVTMAGLIGGVQTQNRGTIGGNIANASPAGDSLPPLLALNAQVTLSSNRAERAIPLAECLQGPAKTALAPDEIIRHVSFEALSSQARSVFLRLGNRRGMVISVVSLAAVLRLNADGIVDDVRIALGAVAPTAIRCHKTESLLLGQPLSEALINEAAEMAVQECSPITDVRGSAGYRRYGTKALVKRGLQTLAGEHE